MSNNLGFYQVAVVAINKVGGPKKFIGLISGVIVLIYGVGAATGPKLIEFFKRVVKAFKGKTDEQILDQAEECQVIQEGATEKGVYFHVGEQIKSYVSKSGVRLFPYCLLTYIMPPLYKR